MTIPKRGEVKYQWALNGEGKVVKISDITPENRHQQFTCINCHCEAREMSPVLSKEGKRQNHFRHKADACSYESYLHAVCKEILKYQFEHKTQWIIRYMQAESCSLFDSCTLRTDLALRCPKRRQFVKEVDLKKLYDTCTIEKEYKGYRADVLLTNSQDSSVEPLFIEVAYKHLCEEEKIQSGIRIIEILVNTEEDAERELIESETIKFWGFERHIEYAGHELNRIQLYRQPNGCAVAYMDTTNCKNTERAVGCFYEIRSNGMIREASALAMAARDIPSFKSCLTCMSCRICKVPVSDIRTGQLFPVATSSLDMNASIYCAMVICPKYKRIYQPCNGAIKQAIALMRNTHCVTWKTEEEPVPHQSELLFD